MRASHSHGPPPFRRASVALRRSTKVAGALELVKEFVRHTLARLVVARHAQQRGLVVTPVFHELAGQLHRVPLCTTVLRLLVCLRASIPVVFLDVIWCLQTETTTKK